jgi:hypothetical protein
VLQNLIPPNAETDCKLLFALLLLLKLLLVLLMLLMLLMLLDLKELDRFHLLNVTNHNFISAM